MNHSINFMRVVILATAACVPAFAASGADLPPAIQAPGETIVLQTHALGAQVYECKADASGKTIWQFREPIATLMRDGKTIGRHYAGPNWEIEGSTVVGKVAANAPGATSGDVAWLKLNVTDRHGDGPLKDVTTVQRIDTKGGALSGACDKAGDFRAEAYSADYIFLRK
jgi:hypothetical protein